jgi:hypothetical protein
MEPGIDDCITSKYFNSQLEKKLRGSGCVTNTGDSEIERLFKLEISLSKFQIKERKAG